MSKKKLKSIKLVGKHFYLKILNLKDVNKKYLSWLNDKKVTQYLENPQQRYTKKDLIKYVKEINFNKKMIFAVIVF